MGGYTIYDCGCQGYDEDDMVECASCRGGQKSMSKDVKFGDDKILKEFVTKDSGKRQEFASGMRRDVTEGKARYDLVHMPMLKRWADLMGRGAVKYGENNWQKATTQEELNRFRESAFRHFIQWFNGEAPEEDHAAAVFFNISGAEYVKQRLGR